MEKPVLCVIDMQPYFETSVPIVKQVIGLIKTFVRNDWPIIIVEYGSCGDGYTTIHSEVKNYANAILIKKYTDDGGEEIIAEAEKHQIPLQNIVVCGVNACCCVVQTLQHLCSKLPYKPDICIEKNAVGCFHNYLGSSSTSSFCMDNLKTTLKREFKTSINDEILPN